MFYRLPKVLCTDEKYSSLSNDAKLLYTFLNSRSEMSAKNGWIDENGNTYIYFGRDEMARMLGISSRTAVRVMAQLTEVGLITSGDRVDGPSPRLYVKQLLEDAAVPEPAPEPAHKEKVEFGKSYDAEEVERMLLDRILR